MRRADRAAAVALWVAVVAPAGAASSRFDGAWEVAIDCPDRSEATNAKGYDYRFPATVKDGVLSGNRNGDEPGSLTIEGPIAADGSALLQARGRTGDPTYAVGRPAKGSAYRYRIQAQFDGDRGTGERLEQRVCHFTFVRR